jgi:large subunit ribosomal protein L17
MRHRRSGRKFGLPSDQRLALLKGLTRNMIWRERILTTETRAKEVRPIVEKLVTLARKGGADAAPEMRTHTRRLARRYLDSNVSKFVQVSGGPKGGMKLGYNPDYVIPRLFDEIAPRYMNRPGGYTRITRVGFRRGDGAPMVLLEFVESEIAQAPAAEAQPAAEQRRGLLGLGRRKS